MDQIINVVYQDLDPHIKGLTKRNKDLSYTIVLNPVHSRETLLKTYRHELEHIEKGDYDNPIENVDKLEAKRHNLPTIRVERMYAYERALETLMELEAEVEKQLWIASMNEQVWNYNHNSRLGSRDPDLKNWDEYFLGGWNG